MNKGIWIVGLILISSLAFGLSIEKHNDTWVVSGAKALDILAMTNAEKVIVYSYVNGHWAKVFSKSAHPGINHWLVKTSGKALIWLKGDPKGVLVVKEAQNVNGYAVYNETCGNGIGYSIPDPFFSWSPHYCHGGGDCCNWYVKSHVHDLQQNLTGNYSISITYRPGFGEGCTSPLYVDVSADNSTWTRIFTGNSTSHDMDGNPSYPQSWRDYTLNLNYNGTFRWIKVSIPNCYVDWSSVYVSNNTDNQAPIANFTVNATEGYAPLTVLLNASNSWDDQGVDNLSFSWRFGGRGFASGMVVEKTFTEPGTFDIELTVTDPYGMSDTLTKKDFFTVWKPVKITSVSGNEKDGAYYTNDQNLTIEFTGDTDSGYTIYVNGNATETTNNTTAVVSLSLGNNTVCVEGSMDNQTSQDCVNVSYDTQPPNCTLDSVEVYGDYAVMKYSCDKELSKAFFWTDVNQTVLVDTTPGVTKFPDLPDGERTLHLIPQDLYGNNGTELNATVTINANPPEIVIVSPVENETINATAVNVTAYSPSSDVQAMYVEVYNGTWNSSWKVLANPAQPNVNYSLVISGLSNGNYTAAVKAVDNNSNEAIRSVNFTINYTVPMPIVHIVRPTQYLPYSNSGYLFYDWVAANWTEDRTWFYVNESDGSNHVYTCYAWLDGNYVGSVSDLTSGTRGEIQYGYTVNETGKHTVKVKCVDQDDSNRYAEDSVEFYVDDTIPVVDFLGPNGADQFPNNYHNGTYWTNNMKIYLNVTDENPGVMRVYIEVHDGDETGPTVVSENTSIAKGWYQIDTSNLNGTQHNYTICVYAVDYINYQSPKVCRKVTYDTVAPPRPSWFAPDGGGIAGYNDIFYGANVTGVNDFKTCWINVHNNDTGMNFTIYDDPDSSGCYNIVYTPDCKDPNDLCYYASPYYIEDWAGNIGVYNSTDGAFGVDGNGPNVIIDSIDHDPTTDEANITFHVEGDNATKVEYSYVYVPMDHWDDVNHRPCGVSTEQSPWYPVDDNVSNVTYPITPGTEVTFHVDDLPESGYFCNGTKFDPRIEIRAYNENNRIGVAAVSDPLVVDNWWRKIYYVIAPDWSNANSERSFNVYMDIEYIDNDSRFNNSFLDEPPNTDGAPLLPNVTFNYDLDDKVDISDCWLRGIENPYSQEYYSFEDDALLPGWWATLGDDPSLNYTHYLTADGLHWDGYRYAGYEETIAVWECDSGVVDYTLYSTLQMQLWNGTVVNISVSSSGDVTPYSTGPGEIKIAIGSPTGEVPDYVKEEIRRRVIEKLNRIKEIKKPKIKEKGYYSPALAYPATFLVPTKQERAKAMPVKVEKAEVRPEKREKPETGRPENDYLLEIFGFLVIVSLVPLILLRPMEGE